MAVTAAAVGVALYAAYRIYPHVFDGGLETAHLVYLAAVLIVLAPVAFAGRLRQNLRNLLAWAAILAALMVGYAQWQAARNPATSLQTELLPQRDSADTAGEARFRANRRGAFVAEGQINGVDVVFLIDTGASDVVLTRADAERVGFVPDNMVFSGLYRTANGTVTGAPVRLTEVSLGGVRLNNVRASVNGGELHRSLLGLSFLNRLSGFAVRDGVLTLYQ